MRAMNIGIYSEYKNMANEYQDIFGMSQSCQKNLQIYLVVKIGQIFMNMNIFIPKYSKI